MRAGHAGPPHFFPFLNHSQNLVWSPLLPPFHALTPAASLTVGNVLPLSAIPEGTVICNVETRPGDRGSIGRASGAYGVIIAQDEDRGTTKVRLPSGAKKTLPNSARGQVREGHTGWGRRLCGTHALTMTWIVGACVLCAVACPR